MPNGSGGTVVRSVYTHFLKSYSILTSYKTVTVQDECECTQKECEALRDQLQLQRESAALSLNRIQQASLKKQKKLVHQIKEQQRLLKQVYLY